MDQNQKNRSKRRPGGRKKPQVFNPKSDANPLNSLFGGGDNLQSRRPVAQPAPPKPAQQRPVPVKKTEFKIIDNIDPVELFAAYHLGVTRDDNYKQQNINEVARRFNSSPGRIRQILKEYGQDSETVMNTDFDMGMAQIDIKVAPKGISKFELARQLYAEFREAPILVRDWQKEIKDDAAENRRIFDKLK